MDGGHLYHPKWKGYLMVLMGGVNLGTALTLKGHGVSVAWVWWFFCLWCFGWGFWWLRQGWKDGNQ